MKKRRGVIIIFCELHELNDYLLQNVLYKKLSTTVITNHPYLLLPNKFGVRTGLGGKILVRILFPIFKKLQVRSKNLQEKH